jgi:hypothetical protein
MDINFLFKPRYSFSYLYSIDLNKYFNEQEINVLDSAIRGQLILGKDPLYEWSIGFKFGYETTRQNKVFDINLYTLQSLEITKKEHERILSFKFDKSLNEFRIIYTFLVFPDDPIELAKTGNNFTFQGKLNKQAEQR